MKNGYKILIIVGTILIAIGIIVSIVPKKNSNESNKEEEKETKEDENKKEEKDPYSYILERDTQGIDECIGNYAKGNRREIKIEGDKTVTISYLTCGTEKTEKNKVEINYNDSLISTFSIIKSSREDYKKEILETSKKAFHPFPTIIYGDFETAQKNCKIIMKNDDKIVDVDYYYIYEIDSEYILLINIDSPQEIEDGFYDTVIESIKIENNQ